MGDPKSLWRTYRDQFSQEKKSGWANARQTRRGEDYSGRPSGPKADLWRKLAEHLVKSRQTRRIVTVERRSRSWHPAWLRAEPAQKGRADGSSWNPFRAPAEATSAGVVRRPADDPSSVLVSHPGMDRDSSTTPCLGHWCAGRGPGRECAMDCSHSSRPGTRQQIDSDGTNSILPKSLTH